jgi:hypothetical protein
MKAAKAELPAAEYAIGYFTEVGLGVPPNIEGARGWYTRAAGTYRKVTEHKSFPLILTICLARGFWKARKRLEELADSGASLTARDQIADRAQIRREVIPSYSVKEQRRF